MLVGHLVLEILVERRDEFHDEHLLHVRLGDQQIVHDRDHPCIVAVVHLPEVETRHVLGLLVARRGQRRVQRRLPVAPRARLAPACAARNLEHHELAVLVPVVGVVLEVLGHLHHDHAALALRLQVRVGAVDLGARSCRRRRVADRGLDEQSIGGGGRRWLLDVHTSLLVDGGRPRLVPRVARLELLEAPRRLIVLDVARRDGLDRHQAVLLGPLLRAHPVALRTHDHLKSLLRCCEPCVAPHVGSDLGRVPRDLDVDLLAALDDGNSLSRRLGALEVAEHVRPA